MRELGGRRPTCEECGKVELEGEEELFVIHFLLNFRNLLITSNGFGGWSINPEGVRFICDESGYKNRLRFAYLVGKIISTQQEILETKKEEPKKENADANEK